MKKKKRILFIGPAPQNSGGVSVHIRRLAAAIADDCTIDYIDEGRTRWPGVFNLRSLNIFRYFAKIARADVVHIHSVPNILRIANMLTARLFFKKPVVTIHFDTRLMRHPGRFRRSMSLASQVIAVNEIGYNFLKEGKDERKYHHKPAFLPPVMKDEPMLDDEITGIIDGIRRKGGRIAVSNSWHVIERGGDELYGLDLCIDAAKILKEKNSDIYIIFVVAEPDGCRPLYDMLTERIRKENVGDRLIVIGHSLSFVRLIEKADMVIRATKNDGDALTVREALWLGRPCIASDAAERPEGTTVFKSRDVNALVSALENPLTPPESVSESPIPFYKKIYNIE